MNNSKFKIGQKVKIKSYEKIRKIDTVLLEELGYLKRKNAPWAIHCKKIVEIVDIDKRVDCQVDCQYTYSFKNIGPTGWLEAWLDDLLIEKLKLLG